MNVFLNSSRHTHVTPGGGDIKSRGNDTSTNQKPDSANGSPDSEIFALEEVFSEFVDEA